MSQETSNSELNAVEPPEVPVQEKGKKRAGDDAIVPIDKECELPSSKRQKTEDKKEEEDPKEETPKKEPTHSAYPLLDFKVNYNGETSFVFDPEATYTLVEFSYTADAAVSAELEVVPTTDQAPYSVVVKTIPSHLYVKIVTSSPFVDRGYPNATLHQMANFLKSVGIPIPCQSYKRMLPFLYEMCDRLPEDNPLDLYEVTNFILEADPDWDDGEPSYLASFKFRLRVSTTDRHPYRDQGLIPIDWCTVDEALDICRGKELEREKAKLEKKRKMEKKKKLEEANKKWKAENESTTAKDGDADGEEEEEAKSKCDLL